MNIRDAFQLAWTKCRTRLVRNILVAFTLSLGLTLILVLLIGSRAILNQARVLFGDSLTDRWMVAEIFSTVLDIPEGKTPQDVETQKAQDIDIDRYRAEQDANIQNFYVQYTFFPEFFGIDVHSVIPDVGKPQLRGIQSTSEIFIHDFVLEEHGWDERSDTIIPVIVPRQYLFNTMNMSGNSNDQESYEQLRRVRDVFLGKEFVLLQGSDPDHLESTDVYVRIVGFSTEDRYGSGAYDGSAFIIPLWALDRNASLRDVIKPHAEIRIISEFASKEARDAFQRVKFDKWRVEQDKSSTGEFIASTDSIPLEFPTPFLLPVKSRFEAFSDIVSMFRKIFFGLASGICAIAGLMLMSTIGKIIADSRREIGVFRAIGAQKIHIVKIFSAYVFLLVAGAFTFALFFSYSIVMIVSLVWGDNIFYTLAQLSPFSGVVKPQWFFVGFPLFSLLLVALGACIVGLLASAIPLIRAARVDPMTALREE